MLTITNRHTQHFMLCCMLLTTLHTAAQNVGINNPTPNASAMLDITSTNRGLLLPRIALTATNVAAPVTTPATSLLIYNTATAGTTPNNVAPGYYYWNGTQWVALLNDFNIESKSWLTNGNDGTIDGTNFIGTTDNVPLNFRVNNQKAGRIDGTLRNVFWGRLAGNSNTTGNDNVFIGDSTGYANTTGDVNIGIGSRALRYNTVGNNNTATGYYTLNKNTFGSGNVANGYYALKENTTGSRNTASGYIALFMNTTGDYNTATGNGALSDNTTGSYNTATGSGTLIANTIGICNTAIGSAALSSNLTGYVNTSCGYMNLLSNTTGNYNTGNGSYSLRNNISGDYNTASGNMSLYNNSTGNYNSAIGDSAGYTNSTGNFNSYVGYKSTSNTSALNNATAIGSYSRVDAGNSLVLGSVAGINGATASVNVGIGETAPASDLHVKQNSTSGVDRGITLERSTGTLWRTYVDGSNLLTFEYNNTGTWGYINTAGTFVNGSDRRLKHNIATAPSLLNKVMQLKPSMYNYISQPGDAPLQYGFIAQDVQPLFPEMITVREDGMMGIAYGSFSVVAIKAIQEQQVMIDELKTQNAALLQRLNAIEAKLK